MTWGWMAEFASADALLDATRAARSAGYVPEAYAPFHIEGLAEAAGARPLRIAAVTVIGGMIGCVFGYAMQWYGAVADRPLDVGDGPLHGWPMFMGANVELTVLAGAFAAVIAFLWASGLPQLAHALFAAPDFDLATHNRFVLVLRADDPVADLKETPRWLDGLEPLSRVEVAR